MESISFLSVLPQVFAAECDLSSELWCKDVIFSKGECTLVQAASGTGKSTLCSYITGFRHDYSGKILFDASDISSFSHAKWTAIRRSEVSLLFQELRLFPELTAMENVEIKNRLTGYLSRSRIEEMFDMLGIADKLDARIGQMSFGQQQRVGMIRALAQPFDFILLDEPVSHLDESNSATMASLLLEEARRQGAGIIATSIGKHMSLPYNRVLKL